MSSFRSVALAIVFLVGMTASEAMSTPGEPFHCDARQRAAFAREALIGSEAGSCVFEDLFQEQSVPPSAGTMWQIDAVDEDVAWAAGFSAGVGEGVLKTTDGGGTWCPTGPPVDNQYFALHAFDDETCIIGAGNGVVWRGTGASLAGCAATVWDSLYDVGGVVKGIHFFDDQRGWLMGDYDGVVDIDIDTGPNAGSSYPAREFTFTTQIHTVSGQAMSGPTVYVGHWCAGVAVPPAPGAGYVALIVGDPNGSPCSDWARIAEVAAAGYEGVIIAAEEGQEDLFCFYEDEDHVIPGVWTAHSAGLAIAGVSSFQELVVGAEGAQVTVASDGYFWNMWTTTDGGTSWMEALAPAQAAHSCEFQWPGAFWWGNEMEGFFGGFGHIYRTTDGGQAWQRQPIGLDLVQSVVATPSGVGFAGGTTVAAAGPNSSPALFRTTDSGESWHVAPGFPLLTDLSEDTSLPQVRDVAWVPGEPEFWVFMVSDVDPQFWGFFRTLNQGVDWEPCTVSVDFLPYDLKFSRPTETNPVRYSGWAVGERLIQGNSTNAARVFGMQTVVGVPPLAAPVPASVSLLAHPNPFNPGMHLVFELSEPGQTSLGVYDVAGRLVRMLVAADLDAGRHEVAWDGSSEEGRGVRSGVYFALLRSGAHELRQKLVLAK